MFRQMLAAAGGLAASLLLCEALLTAWPHVALAGHRVQERDAATTVVAWGDSVTFGHGLTPGQAWPDQLQASLDRRGVYDVAVENQGAGGRTLNSLTEGAPKALQRVTARGSVPEVVVLLGHNNFVHWKGRPVNPFPQGSAVVMPRVSWQPRLLRVIRWGVALAGGVPPESIVDQRTQRLLIDGLTSLKAQTEAAGGRLWVATYPVPGRPPDDLDETRRSWIETTRVAQVAGNALLRDVASDLDLPLIDLHRDLAVPGTWGEDWWLDHIHPTAAGARAIADEMERHLDAGGVF